MEESQKKSHRLAEENTDIIKEFISNKFLENIKALTLLLNNPKGAYISEKEEDTLVVFVYSNESKQMYAVFATVSLEDKLTNLKATKV